MTKVTKIYGPPGTGKTEKLIRRAMAYIRVGTPVNKIDKTGQMLIDFFKAELGHGKRYPKKPTQKKSNNPVRCVKIPMSNFTKEENEIEILPMKSKKDIL